MSRPTRDRRRAEAHRLADPEGEALGVREIARRLGVNPSTISRDLREPAPTVVPLANIQDASGRPVAGAEPDNARALVHGCFSERRLAPLREAHAASLARDFPNLDDRRLLLLADRLARVDLASGWLDAQGDLVRNSETGEPFAIVKELERWSSRAEQVLAEVEAEHRKQRRFDHLGDYMDDGDDDEEADGDGTDDDE